MHDEAPEGRYTTFCADSKTKTTRMPTTTTKTTTTCGGRVPAPNLARRRPEWCSESRRAKCSEACPSTPRMVPESTIYCSKQDRTQFTQLSGHLSGDVKLASFGGILGGAQRARAAPAHGAPRPRVQAWLPRERGPSKPGPDQALRHPEEHPTTRAKPCAKTSSTNTIGNLEHNKIHR